jgi:hypothetical protein
MILFFCTDDLTTETVCFSETTALPTGLHGTKTQKIEVVVVVVTIALKTSDLTHIMDFNRVVSF